MASARRYFFIVGTPRSGTTLMRKMLMQSPGVSIPPETNFIGITYLRRGRLGAIGSDAGWQAAVNAVISKSKRMECPLDHDALRDQLQAMTTRDYGPLFKAWLDAYGDVEHATVIGEKTPVHTAYVDELNGMFPGAKFVHIIRDPRDVSVSKNKKFDTPALSTAMRWRADQKLRKRYLNTYGPDRYRVVRYEDLVGEPEPHLRGLAEFLDIEFAHGMADPFEPGKAKPVVYGRVPDEVPEAWQGITSSRIARYKNELDPAYISVIQALCGKEMQELGYELEPLSKLAGWARAISQAPGMLLARRRSGKVNQQRLDREAALAD